MVCRSSIGKSFAACLPLRPHTDQHILIDRLARPNPLRLQHSLHEALSTPILPPHDSRNGLEEMVVGSPRCSGLHSLLRHWSRNCVLNVLPTNRSTLALLQRHLQQAVQVYQRTLPVCRGRCSQLNQRLRRRRSTMCHAQHLQPRHPSASKDRLECDLCSRSPVSLVLSALPLLVHTLTLISSATGCGIARTYYLWQILHTTDSVWIGYELFAWSIVECQLAIICACAPTLRVFYRRYLSDHIKRTFNSVSHYASGSREPNGDSTMHTSMTGTIRDSRGFCELKELERGTLARAGAGVGTEQISSPSPTSVGRDRYNDSHDENELVRLNSPGELLILGTEQAERANNNSSKSSRDTFTGGWMQTAPITAADEYNSNAAAATTDERSKGMIAAEESVAAGITVVRPRSSHTESILNRFDDFVVGHIAQFGRRTTIPK